MTDVVEERHVGGFSFGNLHHGRNQPAQIELRMQLHARVGGPIVGPREDRQTQVDDGGVQGVHRVRQIDRERVVEIQRPGRPDQALREVRVDAPVARFVRIGQGRPRHARTNTDVVELRLQRAQTGFDVAQTLAIRQLREGHAQVLIPTREPRDLVFAVVPGDTRLEFETRDVIHQLREDRAARLHAAFCDHPVARPTRPCSRYLRRYRKVQRHHLSRLRSTRCGESPQR